MEFEKSNMNEPYHEGNLHDGNNIDMRDIIDKYLIYWKWFILSLLVSISLAYYQLNFIRPTYEATATIKIKDEKRGDKSALSAFQDLGVMSAGNESVDDEIEILKSKSIVGETVKALNLNIQYFTDKNFISSFLDDNIGTSTEFYERERYKNPPLEINFFKSDSAVDRIGAKFLVRILSNDKYIFTDYGLEEPVSKTYSFGEKIKTTFSEIIILPNIESKQDFLNKSSVLVLMTPVTTVTNTYVERLSITPKAEYSSVLSLTVSDGVKKKAEDFLNELVNKYNERAVSLKKALTKSTSDFVNRRLEIISTELSNVDLTAESIKTRFQLSDAASETGLNMQSGQAIENQIVQTNAQLAQIGYIKDYVSTKGENDLIPADVGVSDNNVSTSVSQYNQMMMQKKKLLENSTEKNPIVVNLSEQLRTLKNNINQGLNNLESSQKISLNALTEQDARINSRLYAAPKQERQYRDIQRQQQIKEQLYLYLLEKREETAITLGVADPNAKIIDYAESWPYPVAPKKKIFYLVALFVGILLPFGVVYLINALDSKIHTREDVEKILNIPVLGDIPKLETKKRYLITKDDHSSIAEAFRILRTNLNFILNSSLKGKTIFVTSTIAHEGKSLVSTNLATSLAHGGKKVLLLGMDIRAPKIEAYLSVRGNIGVTNYIVNSDISVEDLIVTANELENLDIISSGDIAPNPSELLMNPRVKDLFDYAKEHYDYVIVDTAAFSKVTDTMLLSNLADAFIYVIRANYLDKRLLKYIKSIHSEKRLPNLSLLINGVDHKKAYGYGYGYGYGTNFEKSQRQSLWKKLFS